MKELLGSAAVVISIVTTIPYVIDTLKGKTKPHLFTWLVWTVLMSLAFAAQLIGGAGPGAWATGSIAAISVVVLVLSITHGEKHRSVIDWMSLAGCALAGLAWIFTDNPAAAIVLVATIDGLAYVPTYAKSWHKPFEETLSTHAWCGVTHVLQIAALYHYNVTTALYPLVLLLMDAGLVAILVKRRQTKAPLGDTLEKTL